MQKGLHSTLRSVKKKKEKLNTKERVESREAKMRGHLTNSCNTDQGKKNQTTDPWALKETGRLCKGLKGESLARLGGIGCNPMLEEDQELKAST